MKMMALSVVIPIYNEEENLPELIARCISVCKKIDREFEIILVDDGSSDSSGAIITKAAGRYPQVVALILNKNFGQHAAVMAGLAQRRGGRDPGCRPPKSARGDSQAGS